MRDEEVLWAERALIWERMDEALGELKKNTGLFAGLVSVTDHQRKEIEARDRKLIEREWVRRAWRDAPGRRGA